jgi:amino acid transporter
MLSASRVTMTMAQDRILPARLAVVHRVHQTPSFSLVLNAAVYSLLAFFKFQQLIFLNSAFQIANILIIGASLVAVRSRKTGLRPAFLVPLGRPGLFILMLPTCILALVVGYEINAPRDITIVVVVALAGALLYWIRVRGTIRSAARGSSA